MSALALVMAGCGAAADTPIDWSGWYAGVALQINEADTEVVGNRFTYNQNSDPNVVRHDAYGGAGLGLFLGHNWQRQRLVFGGEFALSVTDLSSDLVFNADNDIDQVDIAALGHLSARLGYVVGSTLFYGRGGLAFARISNLGGDMNAGGLDLDDIHQNVEWAVGPAIGIGAEHILGSGAILRLEYSHSDFPTYSQGNNQGAIPGVSQVYNVDNGPIRALSLGLVFRY